MTMTTSIYMPIRENTDGPWVQTSIASIIRADVEKRAAALDQDIPAWAKENPVVRIGIFDCAERVE